MLGIALVGGIWPMLFTVAVLVAAFWYGAKTGQDMSMLSFCKLWAAAMLAFGAILSILEVAGSSLALGDGLLENLFLGPVVLWPTPLGVLCGRLVGRAVRWLLMRIARSVGIEE